MRRLLLSFFTASLTVAASAQTIATFEDLTLSKADTFYVNYSSPGNDVGFNDGLAHFPCVYDTSGGYSFWSSGFVYSNMTDSVTSGFGNEYSAKTAKGYNNSNNYAVLYGVQSILPLRGAAVGKKVSGFYITNSTYAFNSMRDGDMFAKKFSDSDWFKVTIKGYKADTLTTDSVDFYLADFRSSNKADHYIVNTWKWVNLLPLGNVDSLQFTLNSSDTGMYGINTPTYFCIDNFTTDETDLAVNNVAGNASVKVYPNPAINYLFIEQQTNLLQQISIFDAAGRLISSFESNDMQIKINTASFTPGLYLLKLSADGKQAAVRFVKQ